MAKRKATPVDENNVPIVDTPQQSQEDTDFSAHIAALQKRFPGKIFLADEYTMPWTLRRLPTGIVDLDIALQGGLPGGGMTMITGPENVGKNYIANRVIAGQQTLYGPKCRIGVVSTEMPWDKSYAHACNIAAPYSKTELEAETRAFRAAEGCTPPPELIEMWTRSVGNITVVPPSTAEASLEIAVDMARSGFFNVVLIDSFGSMLPASELEKSLEDEKRMGGAAGLNTSFMRKLNEAMGPDKEGKPNLTCIIGINQIRDNMDRPNKYSPKTIETGGRSLKHGRWVTIELRKAGKIKKTIAGKETPVGKEVHWEIVKQKAGGHEGETGDYSHFYCPAGIDRGLEAVRVAKKWGVISTKGSWHHYDGQVLGNSEYAAATVLNQSLEMILEIETAVLRAAKVHVNY